MKVTEVRDFSKRGDALPIPNLIEVQQESYKRFLQQETEVAKRKNEGLEALLREDTLGRERADELLVADALVTYAFEAAATSASDLDEFAAMVMTRLAGLSSAESDGPDA